MQIESIEDTKRLLRDWGKWAKGRIGTEHAPASMMFINTRWAKFEPVVYDGQFNDDLGLAVDAAVAMLGRFDLEGRDILVAYYRDGLSERKIVEIIKAAIETPLPPSDAIYLARVRRLTNRYLLRTSLAGAESYISAVLSMSLQQAA